MTSFIDTSNTFNEQSLAGAATLSGSFVDTSVYTAIRLWPYATGPLNVKIIYSDNSSGSGTLITETYPVYTKHATAINSTIKKQYAKTVVVNTGSEVITKARVRTTHTIRDPNPVLTYMTDDIVANLNINLEDMTDISWSNLQFDYYNTGMGMYGTSVTASAATSNLKPIMTDDSGHVLIGSASTNFPLAITGQKTYYLKMMAYHADALASSFKWMGHTVDVLVDGTVVLDNQSITQQTAEKIVPFSVSNGSDITTRWTYNTTLSWWVGLMPPWGLSYEILDEAGTVVHLSQSDPFPSALLTTPYPSFPPNITAGTLTVKSTILVDASGRLLVNANLQIANVDVCASNPLPVTVVSSALPANAAKESTLNTFTTSYNSFATSTKGSVQTMANTVRDAGRVYDIEPLSTLHKTSLYLVSISGTGNDAVAIIGVPSEDASHGAAYIYDKSSGSWALIARLFPDDVVAGDNFGYSVAISGTGINAVAIVGAMNLTGVGAAYIFDKSSTSWAQIIRLTASVAAGAFVTGSSYTILVPGTTDFTLIGAADSNIDTVFTATGPGVGTGTAGYNESLFGRSVAISGTGNNAVAIIGAPGDSLSKGAVYIYEKSTGSWTQLSKVVAASGSFFGWSVGISDDGVAIIMRLHPTGIVYIYSNSELSTLDSETASFFSSVAISGTGNNAVAIVGTTNYEARIYDKSTGSWVLQTTITDPTYSFGWNVAISGTATNAVAIIGVQLDDSSKGAAYIYNSSDTWGSGIKLVATDPAVGANFGDCVAISGTSTDAVAIIGIYTSNSAYIFDNSTISWPQITKLTANNPGVMCMTVRSDTLAALAASGEYAPLQTNGVGMLYITGDFIEDQQYVEDDSHNTGDTGTTNLAVRSDTLNALVADGDYTPLQVNAAGGLYVQTQKVIDVLTKGASHAGPVQAQSAMLNAAGSDRFGYSVAISGTGNDSVCIIGSYGENTNTGAAYIFDKSGGSWSTTPIRLVAGDAAVGDYFGQSVAISGTGNDAVAIIGAYEDDDNGSESGSAYIFDKSIGGLWTQIAKLKPSDGAADDNFGYSVAISGTGNDAVAIIGAWGDNANTGSAYIFDKSGGAWTQISRLVAGDPATDDYFGYSVAISGTGNDAVAIIGAYGDSAFGSAYIFDKSGGLWTQIGDKLVAEDAAADDYFGRSVAISGTGNDAVAIIGANGNDSGSAYIFDKSGGSWTQISKLVASDGAANDGFGRSVAISGTGNDAVAIIGANGDDDNGSMSGSAYIFNKSGGLWTQIDKLVASDGAAYDYFGWDVTISGTGNDAVSIIGAPLANSFAGTSYIFSYVANISLGPFGNVHDLGDETAISGRWRQFQIVGSTTTSTFSFVIQYSDNTTTESFVGTQGLPITLTEMSAGVYEFSVNIRPLMFRYFRLWCTNIGNDVIYNIIRAR
jgi:hypothetical protein